MMKAKTVMSSMTETVIDLGFCRRGIISEGSRPHRADDLDRAALSDITATEPTVIHSRLRLTGATKRAEGHERPQDFG